MRQREGDHSRRISGRASWLRRRDRVQLAKAALPQFARALARELADSNIRVNCVSPGVIRTPFQDLLTPEQG